MFIGPNGLVSLDAFLLSPGYSIDIVARSIDNFLGGHLENVLIMADSRLQLRCIFNFKPSLHHREFIKEMQSHGWYFRIHESITSADTIIGDGEYIIVSDMAEDASLVHYSEDKEFCSIAQHHFIIAWEQSAEIIFEDLFASFIPQVERKIITLSSSYWDEFLAKLVVQPNSLFELTPRKFEELIAELLIRDGFDVSLTPETRDGGRDILASNKSSLGEHIYYVECKRYASKRPVDVSLVRALYGVLEAERATAGLLITTSYFTKDAIKFRDTIRHRMSFKDYKLLVKWIGKR